MTIKPTSGPVMASKNAQPCKPEFAGHHNFCKDFASAPGALSNFRGDASAGP